MLGLLLLVPLVGIFMISIMPFLGIIIGYTSCNLNKIKIIGLSTLIVNLFFSIVVFMFLILVVINFNSYKNIIV